MELHKAQNSRLDWIEAGRGIAATLVVISHVNTTHVTPLQNLGVLGAYGVAYFFVLSGFLMLHIHRTDINQPGSLLYFLWRRLVRIFPTYWISLIILLSVNLLLQKSEYHVTVNPIFLLNNFLILPGADLFLGQSWTLRMELFFYAVFSCAILNKKLGIALFVSWFTIIAWRLIVIGIWTGAVKNIPDIYIHHVNFYFFAGLLIALAQFGGWLRPFILGAIAMAVLLLGLAESVLSSDYERMIALVQIPVFAAVLGMTVALSRGNFRAPRFLTWLGKISYSLYLIHLAVYIVLRGLDNKFGRPLDAIWPARVLIQLVAAFGTAAVMNRFVEQPVLAWAARQKTLFGFSVLRKPAVRLA